MGHYARKWLGPHRTEWFGPQRRLYRTKLVVCCALLAAIAIAPKLWLSTRTFPLAPAISWLPEVGTPYDWLLFGALVLCVSATALALVPGSWALLAAGLGATLVLFDQNRLQPWFYMYAFVLVALGSRVCHSSYDAWSERTWRTCGFIIASTYCWSGIQKAQAGFALDVYPRLMEPLLSQLPDALDRAVVPMGWMVGPFEFGIGICFFIPRLRALGVLAAAAMHGFLLLILGPLGHNYNAVIWPWNVGMALMSAALFWGNPEPLFAKGLFPKSALGWGVATLFGIMPAFSFVGWWDDYLSASLYSGLTKDCTFQLTDSGAIKLIGSYHPYLKAGRGRTYTLDVNTWSMSDLNVPPYPEMRVYDRIAEFLCREGVAPGQLRMVIRQRPHPITSKRSTTVKACCTESAP